MLLFITTLSKETSVLLILIYYIHYKNLLSKPVFKKLLVAQVLIFLITKAVINIIYINNPGSVVEFHLLRNFVLYPYSVAQFTAFIIIGLITVYDWNNKPLFLRNSLFILIPLLLLTFVLGYLDEYRDYYEIYPIALLLIFHSVAKLFKLEYESVSSKR